MARAVCGKEELCAAAEAAMACSKMSEHLTDEEFKRCKKDAKRYQKLRRTLADREDQAA